MILNIDCRYNNLSFSQRAVALSFIALCDLNLPHTLICAQYICCRSEEDSISNDNDNDDERRV